MLIVPGGPPTYPVHDGNLRSILSRQHRGIGKTPTPEGCVQEVAGTHYLWGSNRPLTHRCEPSCLTFLGAARTKRHSGGCVSVSDSKPKSLLHDRGWNRVPHSKPACEAGKRGSPRYRHITGSHNTNILHHRLTKSLI